jgi:mono/diheme cytochrome c family protein
MKNFTAVLFLLIPVSCGTSKSTFDSNATVSPTYSSISSVILSQGCTSCHGGAGGYSFDTYNHTIAAVSGSNPAGSALYTSMANGSMPKGGPTLSAAQLKAVSDWIQAGAQNN